jgi:carboxyl-terminal processing protease
LNVDIPVPRSRKQPYAEPKAVTFSTLDASIGYLKVSILPGLLGLDVAREIDGGVAASADCDRLILDLRSHLGGGLGVLRLMSHLSPGKIPIGYTVTRRKVERGYTKESLRRLDHLPTEKPNPLAILTMAIKFGIRDPSVMLVSEGSEHKKWQGRIVILTNEHTISAGEMVCAFARENNLAKIVGTETAGRLIPGSGFKVGQGYMVTCRGPHTLRGADRCLRAKVYRLMSRCHGLPRPLPPDTTISSSARCESHGISEQLLIEYAAL